MSVEVGTAYVSIVPSAEGIGAKLGTLLGGPSSAAGIQAGEQAGGGFASGMSGIVKGVGASLLVGAGIGAGLLAIGNDFHSAFAKIRVDTGATGTALDGLEGSFKTVLAQRPDSIDNVALAISKLRVGLGLTGKPLEDMSIQVLRLSALTKTDLGGNLTAVTQLFNNFGVAAKDQSGKLDELFRASQQTGISVSDLATAMANSGGVLRTAGFSFEDSAALLGLLSKQGINVSTVMPALSKSIKEAATSGKSASQVFQETFDAIRAAPTATAAAGKAIEVFGARAGPKLADAIRTGKLSYQDLAKTIASGSDTIGKAANDTAGFGAKWKIFLNSVRVAIEPLATAVFGLATDALGTLVTVFQKIGPVVRPAIDAIKGFFSGFGDRFGDIGKSAEGIVGPLESIGRALGKIVVPIVLGFFRDLGQVFDGLVSATGKVATAVAGALASALSAAARAVQRDLIPALKTQVLPALKDVSEFIKTDVVPIFDHAGAAVATAGTAITGAWNDVKAALSGGLKVGDGGGAIKAVADAANELATANHALSTSLADVAPGLSGFGDALGPLAILISPLGTAVAFLYQSFKPFRDAVDATAKAIGPFLDQLGSQFAPIIEKIVAKVEQVGTKFDTLAPKVEKLVSVFARVITVAVGPLLVGLGVLFEFLKNEAGPAFQFLGEAITTFVNGGILVLSGAIDIIVGVLSLVVDLLTGDWSAAWDDAGQIVQGIAEVIEGTVGTLFGQIINIVNLFFGTIGAIFATGWGLVSAGVGAAFGAVLGIVEAVLGAVFGVIESVVGSIVGFWQVEWDGIVATVAFIWAVVQSVVGAGINFVSAIISGVLAVITGIWNAAWGALSGVVSAIWGGIVAAVNGGLGFVRGIFDGFVGGFNAVWNGFWGGLKGVVQGIAGPIASAFNAVIGGIRSAWNAFARAWNGISIHVPAVDFGPVHIGGGSIDTPNLPLLAKGALLKARPGGVPFVGAEAGKDEAVIPLPKLRDLLSMAAVPQPAETGGTQRPVNFNGPIYANDDAAMAKAVVKELEWSEKTGGDL